MRIAVATIGSNGDVMPFVWLAERLRALDLDVVAISHPNFKSAFEGRSIEFRPAGPTLDPDERASVTHRLTATKNPRTLMDLVIDEVVLKDARLHYSDCGSVLRECDALVCHHLYFAAQASARSLGVPWAGAVLMPNMLESRRHPPSSDAPLANLGPANTLAWAISKRLASKPSRRMSALVESLSGEAHALSFFGGVSDSLNLLAASPAVSDLTDLPRAFRVTGAWLPRVPETPQLPADIEAFLAAGPRTVLVTLGTAGYGRSEDTLRIVEEALARCGERALVHVDDAALARTRASERAKLIGFVPFEHLLSRVAAVAHHGGAGTTALACRAGVPSVVVPHFADHFYWAHALVRRGTAPRAIRRERLNARRLAGALARVLDDARFDTAAREVGAAMRSEDGAGDAAARIAAWVGAEH